MLAVAAVLTGKFLVYSWCNSYIKTVEMMDKVRGEKSALFSEHGRVVEVLRRKIQKIEKFVKAVEPRNTLSKPWLNPPPEGEPSSGGSSFAVAVASDFSQRKRW